MSTGQPVKDTTASKAIRVEIEWEPLTEEERRPSPPVGMPLGVYVPVTYPARGHVFGAYIGCCLGGSGYVDVVTDPYTGVSELVAIEWHQEGCEVAKGACHDGMPAGEYCDRCGAYNFGERCKTCKGQIAEGTYCAECGLYDPNEPDGGDE